MRKILLLIAFISPMLCYGQFCVSEGGLKVCDSDKNFIVYDFDSISASDLYNRAKNAILEMYISGKDVMSTNENEMISISAISTDKVYYRFGGAKVFFIVKYNMVIRFKDNKVRFDTPVINSIKTDNPQALPLSFERGNFGFVPTCIPLYKKDGEARYEDPINTIEALFNGITKQVVENIKQGNDSENW